MAIETTGGSAADAREGEIVDDIVTGAHAVAAGPRAQAGDVAASRRRLQLLAILPMAEDTTGRLREMDGGVPMENSRVSACLPSSAGWEAASLDAGAPVERRHLSHGAGLWSLPP